VPAAAQQGPKGDKPAPAAPKGKKPGQPVAVPAAPAPAANIDVRAERAALMDADPEKAAAAAQKLGTSKSGDALDALLDGLAMGLHPKVAAVALTSVGNFKSAASVDVVAYYAKNRNPDVRSAAIGALGRIDDKRARQTVIGALADGDRSVRAAACKVLEVTKDKAAIEPLIGLLKKGDEASAAPLAAMATPDLARKLGELVGDAPDDLLARTLGLILLRPDFGKEESYVEVVVTLGKVPGEEAVVALTNFISATPEKPPRLSRRRAQEVVDQRLTGGQ
jgi:HEAT repeat protein